MTPIVMNTVLSRRAAVGLSTRARIMAKKTSVERIKLRIGRIGMPPFRLVNPIITR